MPDELTATLKNGETIKLRDISLKDAEKRHEFFVALSFAQIGLVHTIDEIDFHAHESLDQIKDFLIHKRGFWMVALNQEEKIVAEVDITIKNLARVRHNGILTIGVLPEFQGLGLGDALMKQALLWAQSQKLLRIELFVFESNIKAQKLYEKFGFVVEGVRKNFFRHDDNTFENDLMMAKYLALEI